MKKVLLNVWLFIAGCFIIAVRSLVFAIKENWWGLLYWHVLAWFIIFLLFGAGVETALFYLVAGILIKKFFNWLSEPIFPSDYPRWRKAKEERKKRLIEYCFRK